MTATRSYWLGCQSTGMSEWELRSVAKNMDLPMTSCTDHKIEPLIRVRRVTRANVRRKLKSRVHTRNAAVAYIPYIHCHF